MASRPDAASSHPAQRITTPEGEPPARVGFAGGGAPAITGADRGALVYYQGEALGALSVAKRPGENLTPVEGKLMSDLAAQVAAEHGRDGIICNAVGPGKILTGAPGDLAANPVSAAYVRSRTPFARLGQHEDVAAVVAFLASDQASYISGVNLKVERRMDGLLSGTPSAANEEARCSSVGCA